MNQGIWDSDGRPLDPQRRRYLQLISAAVAAANVVVPAIAIGAEPQPAKPTTGSADRVSPQAILVAGATGRTGKQLVVNLQRQGHRIRGLARNVEAARTELPGVEWVAADLKKPESLGDISRGIDRIVFAVGSNTTKDPSNLPQKVELGGVSALVDAGKSTGVKHFVMMSSGGVGHADPAATTGFAGLLRYKWDAENYLRRSGLSYTIVRPGSLTDEPAGRNHIALCQGDPVWANLATISRGDVALVIARALFDPAASRKTFEAFNAVTHDAEGWKSAFAKLAAD